MRVDSATMALTSQREASRQHTRHETLTAGVVTGPWNPEDAQLDRQRSTEAGAATRRSLLQETLGTSVSSPSTWPRG